MSATSSGTHVFLSASALQCSMNSILFYDGQCPLCAKEIKLLSRWKSNRLSLVDLHKQTDLPSNKNEMLSVLHYQTENGDYLMGLDASVAAWSHTRIGFLLRPLRWLFIKPLADRLYKFWAQKRACKLGYID